MLSLTKKVGGIVAAATLALSLASAASAATLTWSALPAVAKPNLLATSSGGQFLENDATDVVKVRKSPFIDTPLAGSVYSSVGGTKEPSFLSFALAELQGAISFVWGSPDPFNVIEFYRNGTLIDTATGGGLGNFGENIALPTVMISDIGDGDGFDTFVFRSKAPAFEFSTLKSIPLSPVPVPAAGLMLLTAIGAVSFLRRRKTA